MGIVYPTMTLTWLNQTLSQLVLITRDLDLDNLDLNKQKLNNGHRAVWSSGV